MRNAMTTRAPGGANNWWCKPQVAMIILNNFFGHVLVEMSSRSLKNWRICLIPKRMLSSKGRLRKNEFDCICRDLCTDPLIAVNYVHFPFSRSAWFLHSRCVHWTVQHKKILTEETRAWHVQRELKFAKQLRNFVDPLKLQYLSTIPQKMLKMGNMLNKLPQNDGVCGQKEQQIQMQLPILPTAVRLVSVFLSDLGPISVLPCHSLSHPPTALIHVFAKSTFF